MYSDLFDVCKEFMRKNITRMKLIMKEFKQLGAYGLVVKDNKILLIKKYGVPYDGNLDLLGGTIEFCERPVEALKRELIEKVGIEVKKYDYLILLLLNGIIKKILS